MRANVLSAWRKRGLPRSVEGLTGCMASYSQFGEDMILASIFDREQSSGLYLDLGCYHPIHWSNTYHFYLRGWNGISVDASARFGRLWKKHRPGDIHWHRAVVPTRRLLVEEFVESTGHPATSYCKLTDRCAEVGGDSNGEMPTLAIEDLSKWWPFSQPPDLISTDLEGMDLEVWRHFPFPEFSPRAIAMEAPSGADGVVSAVSLLERAGYEWVGRSGRSLVFGRGSSPVRWG